MRLSQRLKIQPGRRLELRVDVEEVPVERRPCFLRSDYEEEREAVFSFDDGVREGRRADVGEAGGGGGGEGIEARALL